jgi:hypothetical protein
MPATPPAWKTALVSGDAAPATAIAVVDSAALARAQSVIYAAEPRFEVYTIQATGVIEEAFAHLKIITGLIYCCRGATDVGVLVAANGDMNVGRVRKYLTELRAVGDQNTPIIISETGTSALQSARTYVNGTVGDTMILIYR